MEGKMQYHELHAMSTEIVLAAEGAVDEVTAGFKKAEAFVHASEERFTRFTDTSELAQLNHSAGSWFSASPEMFELISLAMRMYRTTRGLFDPAILEALEKAGYDRTIEEVRSQAAVAVHGYSVPQTMEPNLNPTLDRAGLYHFGDLRMEPAGYGKGGRIWLPHGLRIDLGGIGKGWIAEHAARVLAPYVSSCAVDAGGDLFMVGLPMGEKAWRVALEDPCDPGKTLAILKAGPGAVATSTVTKRRWNQDGQTRHHLIDPRTGLPAETDWLSVTVIGPHTAEAEVYAKSLLIGGRREVGRISGPTTGIEFITVDSNGKMWGSPHVLKFLEN